MAKLSRTVSCGYKNGKRHYKHVYADTVEELNRLVELKKQEYLSLSKDKAYSYVYLISNGNYIKIGFSRIPYKRTQELQIASPYELKLIRTYVFDNDDDAYAFEKELQGICSNYRVRGEWYKKQALEIINDYTS